MHRSRFHNKVENLLLSDWPNNEFGDEKDATGKPITYWFRVSASNQRCINMVKYLTKGKPINVFGTYSDKLYTNKNTGMCEISRDIYADRIEFELGNHDANAQNGAMNTQQATAVPTVTNNVAPQPQVAVAEAPKVTAIPTVAAPQPKNDDPADDLPF